MYKKYIYQATMTTSRNKSCLEYLNFTMQKKNGSKDFMRAQTIFDLVSHVVVEQLIILAR